MDAAKNFVESLTENLTDKEKRIREDFRNFFLTKKPVIDSEVLENLPLFIRRRSLAKILYLHELYTKILGVEGIIIEFGCRWGQNLALFQNFRGIYEPFKVGRKVVGFDTFSGLPELQPEDGNLQVAGSGDLPDRYEEVLNYILWYHEQESPISHIKKYEIIKGDASETIEKYLNAHPETIIALAYFDMNLYKPTKDCIKQILPHMPKGAVIAFDELNYFGFPGETIAMNEVLGINNFNIKYSPLEPSCQYIVI